MTNVLASVSYSTSSLLCRSAAVGDAQRVQLQFGLPQIWRDAVWWPRRRRRNAKVVCFGLLPTSTAALPWGVPTKSQRKRRLGGGSPPSHTSLENRHSKFIVVVRLTGWYCVQVLGCKWTLDTLEVVPQYVLIYRQSRSRIGNATHTCEYLWWGGVTHRAAWH